MLPEELAGYKTLYLQTAWDLVRNLESNLFILQSDPQNTDAIESMHIASHSLKSQSLVMKYESLGLVCREMESFFKSVKDGKYSITPDDLIILGEVISEAKESLSLISTEDHEKDLKAVEQKMHGLVEKAGV